MKNQENDIENSFNQSSLENTLSEKESINCEIKEQINLNLLSENKKKSVLSNKKKSYIHKKNLSIHSDELIDLNDSENFNNSIFKETDEASNQEFFKKSKNGESNCKNSNKKEKRENEKINNYCLSSIKSLLKKSSSIDNCNKNNIDLMLDGSDKILHSKPNIQINQNIVLNNLNYKDISKTQTTPKTNKNYNFDDSPDKKDNINLELLLNESAENSTENQIINTMDNNNNIISNFINKKENFSFLPIETKYFKLSKDTRVTHIPNIQDFECLACFHIVNDPKVCAECEKLICQECLVTWWSEKTNKEKECIHCKKTFYDLFMPRIVRNSLNSIIIKCPNKVSGCKENFEYQYLNRHLEACRFTKREAVCNYCKEIFSTTNAKTEILQHIMECPLADVFCEFCNKCISKKKIEKHRKKCEKQFEKCNDCHANFQIFEMKNHSKSDCIMNIKKKMQEEILEKEGKIIEYEKLKSEFEKIKKLNSLAPYFVKFLLNRHKIRYEEKLQDNFNVLKIIGEKFGINSENYKSLTKQELIYRFYEDINSLSKNPVKVITNKKNFGKIYFENGNMYEGKIKDAQPNGKGVLSKLIPFNNYKGEFKDGKFNGEGKYYYTDGAYYIGGFLEDKKHGKGILNMPNGQKYEGDFFNQTITGFGTYTYENGTKYVGFFNDGVKQGEGSEYFYDGDLLFKGFFEKDKKNGYGVLFEKKTLKVFEGQFNNGKRNEENAIFSLKN